MGTNAPVPSRPLRRKWLIPVIGYAVSVASLLWVYWGFDWKTELPKFARAHWGWVAVAVAADLAVYAVQGWRWALLLRAIQPVRWLRSVQAIFIGLLANEVLPLRTGEIVRGYVQALWTRLPFSLVLSSIAVERLFDGLILVAAFYLTGFFVELPGLVRDVSFTLALIVAVAGALLAVAMFHKHHAHAAVKHSRWAEALWHVVEGLHAMGHSRWFYASAAASVAYLALQVLPPYALMRAYGMDLSVGAAAVVLLILRLGTVIPQAPGNVGGFQFFVVLGLMLFGVDKADATTFATIMFLVVTIPLWLGGAVAAALAGVKVKDLQQKAGNSFQQVKRAPQPTGG
jgi:uncharacterized protein (TIRG00374 family)